MASGASKHQTVEAAVSAANSGERTPLIASTRERGRTRLACWFESLAVASRPLQRRPRRNEVYR